MTPPGTSPQRYEVWQKLTRDPDWLVQRRKPERARGRPRSRRIKDIESRHYEITVRGRTLSGHFCNFFQHSNDGHCDTREDFLKAVNWRVRGAKRKKLNSFYPPVPLWMKPESSVDPDEQLLLLGKWYILQEQGHRRRGPEPDRMVTFKMIAALISALEEKRAAESEKRHELRRAAESANEPEPDFRHTPLPGSVTSSELRDTWAILYGQYCKPDKLRDRVPAAQDVCRQFHDVWIAEHPLNTIPRIRRLTKDGLFETAPRKIPARQRRRQPAA